EADARYLDAALEVNRRPDGQAAPPGGTTATFPLTRWLSTRRCASASWFQEYVFSTIGRTLPCSIIFASPSRIAPEVETNMMTVRRDERRLRSFIHAACGGMPVSVTTTPPGRSKHGAERLGDLDGVRADAARSAVDEDAHPRLERRMDWRSRAFGPSAT
ncbi:MAG TPA: hypothetical protein VFF02_15825, partial [Anaeromyxobacteraceae bacterium]|nr:hypothetical protein [Anaeromyxobacteraceae bacterium]